MKDKLNIFYSIIFGVMVIYCCYPLIIYLNTRFKICLVVISFIASFFMCSEIIRKLKQDWIRFEREENTKERKSGLDLVRTIACILVITVHYIIGRGYYTLPAEGFSYFVVTYLRWIAQCCCPLFMILSGYFLCHRNVDKKHYYGLFHWLRNYVIICLFFLAYTDTGAITLETIKNLCNLNYMWYINMYFGLFLLAPFLNILWHALDINKKKILLLLLLLLGSFASVTNFWWTNYWNSLYPILYYFIGACFKENEFKIKRLPVIVLFLLMITLESIYTYYIQPGQTFDWIINFGGYSCAYNALPTVIASCLIFLLLKDIKINNNFFKKVLKNISQNSLELYLLLCMFADGIIFQPIWKLFAPKVGVVGVYFILVPLEVMVATLAGMALNKGLDILQSKLVLIILKFSKRNK